MKIKLKYLLIASYLSLLVSFSLTVFYLQTAYIKENWTKEFTNYGSQHLETFVMLIRQDILSGFYPAITNKSKRVLHQNEVLKILIISKDGNIIFQESSPRFNQEESIKISKDIKMSDETYMDDIGNGIFGSISIWYSTKNLKNVLSNQRTYFLKTLIILFIILYLFLSLLSHNITRPLELLTKKFNEGRILSLIRDNKERKSNHILEIDDLIKGSSQLALKNKKYQEELISNSEKVAMAKIAKQTAHDIRSPLAALDIIMDDIKGLPEDSRELTINAIHRIQEIANNLSSTNRVNIQEEQLSLISNTIKATLNEKNLEFQGKQGLTIELTDTTDQMQFVSLGSTEISRIISNLINNAVQALGDKGQVSVKVSNDNKTLTLLVSDNGSGFPESMLNGPIVRGNTIGKEGGQGLGLHHAYETVIAAEGKFKIFNKDGAHIEIKLPTAMPPKWFSNSINLQNINELVIIDDDQSIHDLWKRVLTNQDVKISVVNARTPEEINNAVINKKPDQLFLIDNDLRLDKTGVYFIKDHDLNAVLVTSGFDDTNVQKFCVEMGITLMPKYLIKHISLT